MLDRNTQHGVMKMVLIDLIDPVDSSSSTRRKPEVGDMEILFKLSDK